MFVKTMWYSANTKEFSITNITGLCILIKKDDSSVFDMVYKNGVHNYTSNLLEKIDDDHNGICIVEIYGADCKSFNDCKCLTPIWRHPAYKEQLEKPKTEILF